MSHRSLRSLIGGALLAVAIAACSGAGGTGASTGLPPQTGGNATPPSVVSSGPPTTAPSGAPTVTPSPVSSATPIATVTPAPGPTPPLADARLHVPQGFVANVIATVGGARELAALPNGDLIVGRFGNSVTIVPNADGPGLAGAPSTFATLGEKDAEGVAFGSNYVFVSTEHTIWRIPYTDGARSGTAQSIAAVRTGSISPTTDGDVHHSTSVAVSGNTLYAGVGSSCNACAETDPTRASVQKMALDGTGMTTQATRIRNAIALATDPATGAVWAGGAGQDNVTSGHPYEYIDPVSTHAATADYGWPACEENQHAYTSGANCANTVVPAVEFPAYSTLIGAAFYPASQTGTYAFPAAWRGGLFVSMHGSWHSSGGVPIDPPHVAFVPFSGSSPAAAVNWSDPTTQWHDFFTGFQLAGGSRIGRTTGVAVGPQGSLFVADDQTGTIFRIRPAGTASSAMKRAF